MIIYFQTIKFLRNIPLCYPSCVYAAKMEIFQFLLYILYQLFNLLVGVISLYKVSIFIWYFDIKAGMLEESKQKKKMREEIYSWELQLKHQETRRHQPSVFQDIQRVPPPEAHSCSLWSFHVMRVCVIFISESYFEL